MNTIDWSQYKAVRMTSAFPSVFDESRFSNERLAEALVRAQVLFRGLPFIAGGPGHPADMDDDGLACTVNSAVARRPPHVEQWKLFHSGLFLHRRVMREVLDVPRENSKRVLDTTETTYHIAEAVGSLWHLYEALGIPSDEAVTIEFSYGDMKGRELVDLSHRLGLPRGYLAHVPKIEVSRTYPLYLWRAGDADISAEICLELFQQFQWEPSLRQLEDEIRPFLGREAPWAAR